MRLNLDEHRRDYFLDGVTIVKDLFPASLIARWRDWAVRYSGTAGRRLDATAGDDWTYQLPGDQHAYSLISGSAIREHLPEMLHWYEALIPTVSAVTHQDVVPSPYPCSDVNILVYDRPGNTIGWHHDTNLITVLIYLTENNEGGTECRLLPGRPGEEPRTRTFLPRAGAVLLMQGRWVLHRGLPVRDEIKIVAPWNYYSTTDQWRPDGFDAAIYQRA
jgi:hypothetical protein